MLRLLLEVVISFYEFWFCVLLAGWVCFIFALWAGTVALSELDFPLYIKGGLGGYLGYKCLLCCGFRFVVFCNCAFALTSDVRCLIVVCVTFMLSSFCCLRGFRCVFWILLWALGLRCFACSLCDFMLISFCCLCGFGSCFWVCYRIIVV